MRIISLARIPWRRLIGQIKDRMAASTQSCRHGFRPIADISSEVIIGSDQRGGFVMVKLICRFFWLAALLVAGARAEAQRAARFSDATKAFVTADQPLILIRDARLLDGIHWQAKDHQDLLVRDGRIAAVGSKIAPPAGAKVIDAAGKTLMPGLVLVHEHLMAAAPVGDRVGFFSSPYEPQVMLAYGTTMARTAGGADMEGDLWLKHQIEAGEIPGPELDVSIYIEGPEKPYFTLARIADAEAARREVSYWADRGATSIKLFFHATPNVAAGAIAEAKKRHMGIAGHLCATHAATAANLGLETLEHGVLASYELVPGAAEGSCPGTARQGAMIKRMAELDPNGPEVGALFKTLLQHHVAITATLAAREQFLCNPIVPPPPRELALLSRPQAVTEPQIPCSHFPGMNAEIEKKSIAFQAATDVRYHNMGGTLLVGTDQWLVPGAGGPYEMETMVRAGLTPIDVLKAATIDGARAIHRGDDLGSLEVGKRADFLLVDGKPDQDISDIRKLTAVFKDGIGYDPQKLYDDAKGKIIN
jgi:enamidase